MSKHPAVFLSAAALAVGLAACGSSSSSSTNSNAPFASSSTSSAAPAGATSSAAGATSSSAAAGATSSSAAAGGAASSNVTIAANPSGQLMFTKKTLAAKAGTVSIQFTNSSPEVHNFTIQEGTNGKVLGATPTFQGGTKTLTVKLAPGTYTFYCSVPGHRMAGMQGTLTVS